MKTNKVLFSLLLCFFVLSILGVNTSHATVVIQYRPSDYQSSDHPQWKPLDNYFLINHSSLKNAYVIDPEKVDILIENHHKDLTKTFDWEELKTVTGVSWTKLTIVINESPFLSIVGPENEILNVKNKLSESILKAQKNKNRILLLSSDHEYYQKVSTLTGQENSEEIKKGAYFREIELRYPLSLAVPSWYPEGPLSLLKDFEFGNCLYRVGIEGYRFKKKFDEWKISYFDVLGYINEIKVMYDQPGSKRENLEYIKIKRGHIINFKNKPRKVELDSSHFQLRLEDKDSRSKNQIVVNKTIDIPDDLEFETVLTVESNPFGQRLRSAYFTHEDENADVKLVVDELCSVQQPLGHILESGDF